MVAKADKNKSVKIKDIMRLFLQYDNEFIPIIDSKLNLKGLIYKNDIINDATETAFIEKKFSSIYSKYINYPEEAEFLKIVGDISDVNKFPALNQKGEMLKLWNKKNLIDSYYKIKKKGSGVSGGDLDEAGNINKILNSLTVNILIVDKNNKIVFANKSFLQNLDFREEILKNQDIKKIFPDIKILTDNRAKKGVLYKMEYGHENWIYSIVKLNDYKADAVCYTFYNLGDFLTFADNKYMREQKNSIKKRTENIEKARLTDIMKTEEKELIESALQRNNWNITMAAKELKIPRQTLQYKINKYKISINVKA